MDLLFVYGTLRQGYTNAYAHFLHTHSSYRGSGTFPGRLYRVSWYPAAIYDPTATSQVHGQLFQLHQPREVLALLDEYEDIADDAGLYVRERIPIQMTKQILLAWVYLYNQPTANLTQILTGVWT